MAGRRFWLLVPLVAWAALLAGLFFAPRATVTLLFRPSIAPFLALHALVGAAIAFIWPWYPRAPAARALVMAGVGLGSAWVSWFAGMVAVFLLASTGGEL